MSNTWVSCDDNREHSDSYGECLMCSYESMYEEVKRLQAEKEELQGELKLLRAACMEWKNTALDCDLEWKLRQDIAKGYRGAIEKAIKLLEWASETDREVNTALMLRHALRGEERED